MKELVNHILNSISKEISSEVVYWDGERIKFGQGKPLFRIHIKSPHVLKDLMQDLSIGFGENYMNNNIVVEGDLQRLLGIGINLTPQRLNLPNKTKLRMLINHIATLNSLRNIGRNIAHHYDLGNDFYQLMLDKNMTYSCGYFKTPRDSLEEAQDNKHQLICRKINLQDGDRLIDIGCGWGSFLVYAAKKFDITAVGCTLSHNQYEYAKKWVKKEGLEKKVSIFLEDYRRMSGRFNKFVSIGMYEHVGKNYASTFFRKVKSLLTDDSIGILHTIGYNNRQPTNPWLKKYIFPGGYLPALPEVLEHMTREGFYIIDVENLRPHYAKTLDEWIKRFESNIDKIKAMFGQKFINMWRLYLNGAAAGFKFGETNVYQILFLRNLEKLTPCYREDIYKNWE